MSIMDNLAAAINGVAAGCTSKPEAREMVTDQMAALLQELLSTQPVGVNVLDRLHREYGIAIECAGGRVQRVILS